MSNLVTIVNGLRGLGAQHILVPGMTDLGLTPIKLREGPASSAAASALSDYFNARLLASLPPLSYSSTPQRCYEPSSPILGHTDSQM